MRIMRALLHRLRHDEGGFSLTELLASSAVGTIVVLAAFQVIDASVSLSAKTQDRVDAIARGRLAMEEMTQSLRSQVCLGPGPGLAAIVGGDSNYVEFYGDLGDNNSRTNPGNDTFLPDKFRLTYDPVAKTITEQVWQGAGTPPNNMTFTLRRTRVLLENVDLVPSTPFLRYYGFSGTEPIAPNRLLAVPLNDNDRARAVQVGISYVARPTRVATTDRRATWFENYVYVRTSDPNDPDRSPQCV